MPPASGAADVRRSWGFSGHLVSTRCIRVQDPMAPPGPRHARVCDAQGYGRGESCRMAMKIRRLRSGDEAVIRWLAARDADYDLEGRGHPRTPLNPEALRAYLANPAVLHWVAQEQERIDGFLQCVVIPLRAGAGEELLLYEIGVHRDHRREGVGTALVESMYVWMHEHRVDDVWVLADNPDAVSFYESVGFRVADEMSTYMTAKAGERRSRP